MTSYSGHCANWVPDLHLWVEEFGTPGWGFGFRLGGGCSVNQWRVPSFSFKGSGLGVPDFSWECSLYHRVSSSFVEMVNIWRMGVLNLHCVSSTFVFLEPLMVRKPHAFLIDQPKGLRRATTNFLMLDLPDAGNHHSTLEAATDPIHFLATLDCDVN